MNGPIKVRIAVASTYRPGHGDPTCPHAQRDTGHCGHCDHELILNGACYFCGTTELEPIALSSRSRR